MSNAYLNGWTFNRGNGDGPPETFGKINGVEGLGGLGQDNPLVRVTNFDSVAEEYIAGLPDGNEFSIECQRDLSDTVQRAMIQDVKDKRNRNLRFVNTNGTDTETYDFEVVCLSFEIGPAHDAQNTISFKFKISGDIVIS